MARDKNNNQPRFNGSSQWNYGIHTIQALLKTSPERIQRLLMSKKRNARLQKIVDLAGKQKVQIEFVGSEEIEQQITSSADQSPVNHQGVCALCAAGEVKDESWLYTHLESVDKPFLLILDGVTDPHNLGACLRTADAVGVHAVIIPKDNSAGMTPVVQKVASGAAESVPLIAVTNLARCMEKLQNLGVWITGTSDQAEQDLFSIKLDGAIAIALGAEGKGLRRLTQEHCDQLVALPMRGVVSSLNVSVATGVCLYEALKQRSL